MNNVEVYSYIIFGGNHMMSTDDRDVLEVLKAELNFLEKGGYGRSVKTPQVPTSIFLDSLSCINFADPQRSHPCQECLLIDFVPVESLNEKVPCHHIPLNPKGETIEVLESKDNQQEVEEVMKDWLRAKISELEKTAEH
ncbi:MAG: hypothetical protein AB1757_28325 [Acidobacteriota bacterium]